VREDSFLLVRSFGATILSLVILLFTAIPFSAFAAIPTGVVKTIPMAKEDSVSTYLPSEAAPGQGLAINIIYPEKPRYSEGAPVVVVAPGGDGPNGLSFCAHAAQVGFIEIRFAFPGGGVKGFSSSGRADYRGVNSQKALRDVLLFAMGKLEDYKERSLKDLVPTKIAPQEIGILAWSNGGNIALETMDKFSDQLQGIGWVAFYESPIGSLFFPPSLGCTKDLVLNKHYRDGSGATGHCLIDFRKLCWDAATKRDPGIHKKLSEPDPPGVLFFDDNGNTLWDESREYAFRYSLKANSSKQYYPPEVTAAMDRLRPFGANWPEQVADVAASEAYFQERDGALCIPGVAQKYPKLMVTVYGSHMDHLQLQPDHPHIQFQYNTWLDNNIHWIRLNPETIYLSDLAAMNTRNFVNNKPNGTLESDSINENLEPEGILPEYVYMEACIAELADRAKTGNMASPLLEPIVKYSNGAKSADKGAPGSKPEVAPTAKESEGIE
jgi:hypothetical protein